MRAIQSEARAAREGASDLEKFGDFYQEATGEAMTEEQQKLLAECIDEMDRENREEHDAYESRAEKQEGGARA